MTHIIDEYDLADQAAAMDGLAAERERRRMSLGDLEQKSGVSTNSFYAWRSGYRAPQLPLLVALAQTLGFDIVMRRIPASRIAAKRPVADLLRERAERTGKT